MQIKWKENGVDKSITIKADFNALDVIPSQGEITGLRDFVQIWIENEGSGTHRVISSHNLEATGFMKNGAKITKKTYRTKGVKS
tara:strand:+ start:160 stop:411 length:252 start_codon:yes stop_codon:yes gene_type:complete